MPPFSTNALPTEFQEEHGSGLLGDDDESKPKAEWEVDDEDLDLAEAEQKVWLCRVPKFVMEKWSEAHEPGQILGRLRVFDEKDSDGNPKMAVLLDPSPTASTSDLKPSNVKPSAPTSSLPSNRIAPSSPSKPSVVPTEYKLTMQNSSTKNLFVFGEKEEDVVDSGEVGHRKRRRVTKMLGTVHHECLLMPSIGTKSAQEAYREIMRNRQRKAQEPTRTIKRLDVDEGTANRMASGGGLAGIKARANTFIGVKQALGTKKAPAQDRQARIPRNELLDMLFPLFQQAPYWSAKVLTEHVKQPQTYLKEVLSDIATLVKAGPYANMWTLKQEFKDADREQAKTEGGKAKAGDGEEAEGSGEGEDRKPVIGKEEQDDDDDDDEMQFESVA